METGFALTACIALDLNLTLPDENSDEETESLAGDEPRSEDGEVKSAETEMCIGKQAEGSAGPHRAGDSIGKEAKQYVRTHNSIFGIQSERHPKFSSTSKIE
ncbi:uncharacterized protein RAG0_02702 [Rhynchosporium agropyri]|uniref:Uncharacterized protein n=1 Tax=Rhynchosporium agropyri TaxID=914238 RepID=A0A1E1K6N3_9HELO|nr:uncharacterized protein RAG0_02702 [Rhynchosporium agropyri]